MHDKVKGEQLACTDRMERGKTGHLHGRVGCLDGMRRNERYEIWQDWKGRIGRDERSGVGFAHIRAVWGLPPVGEGDWWVWAVARMKRPAVEGCPY